MEVILLQKVANLGNIGDRVKVKSGYGRNFLLPKGLAMPATPGNMKVFEAERKKLEARMAELRQQAASLGERIQAAEVVIPMRVGENNKLYGSVTAHSIGEALDALGLEVDRRRILLDSSIRSLGTHTVRVRLHADVVVDLPVTVVPEKTLADEAESSAPETAQSSAGEASAE